MEEQKVDYICQMYENVLHKSHKSNKMYWMQTDTERRSEWEIWKKCNKDTLLLYTLTFYHNGSDAYVC